MDYLKWRGDITFDKDFIRDVDLLVLSQIVYWPFENLKYEKYKNKTLLELKDKIYTNQSPDSKWEWCKYLFKLWKNIEKYPRFSELKLYDFKSSLNEEEMKEKQFAVAVFTYEDIAIVSFRGTDLTLTGWKEDFNMAFEKAIPGQVEALKYLDALSDEFKEVYICGHSKGGNLAMYSALNANDYKRIVKVINFDGPGVLEEAIKGPNPELVKSRIQSYIPRYSVVALIYGDIFKTTVVESDNVSVLQHNPFFWHFDGPYLQQAKKLSTSSQIFYRTIHDFVEDTTEEKRKIMLMAVYKVIDATGAKKSDELIKALITHVPDMVKTSRDLNDEEKEVLKQLRNQIIKSGAQAIIEQKNNKGKKSIDIVNP